MVLYLVFIGFDCLVYWLFKWFARFGCFAVFWCAFVFLGLVVSLDYLCLCGFVGFGCCLVVLLLRGLVCLDGLFSLVVLCLSYLLCGFGCFVLVFCCVAFLFADGFGCVLMCLVI